MMGFEIALDFFPLLAAVLACLACGLLGNFLVLRRLSLMGDAISHSVLPGLVIAFLLTTTRSPMAMFLGAAIAGLITVALVELLKRHGRVEPGAAMGVVFSVLFALGVLLIERASVRHIDLDADCVLYGQLETLAWYDAPSTLAGLWTTDTLNAAPRQVIVLLAACLLVFVFIGLFFKELRIAAFDPGLSTSLGFRSGLLHALLMIFVAIATVASFEAVGSILVIAMLIAPAATARLLTDRLSAQLMVSLVVALITAVGGYWSAAILPLRFDIESLNAAGGIAVFAGFLLTLTLLGSPSHGVLARLVRHRRLARSIAVDDLLATLYRLKEQNAPCPSVDVFDPAVARTAMNTGLVREGETGAELTQNGLARATEIIRRHRSWETYLVEDAGLSPDHVHQTAEQLEHLGVAPEHAPRLDPHGRDIP